MFTCKEYSEEKIDRAAEVYKDVQGTAVSTECIEQGYKLATAFPDFAVPPKVMFSSDYELTFFWIAGKGSPDSHSVELAIYPNGYWVRVKEKDKMTELNGDNTKELPLDKIYEIVLAFTAYVDSAGK